MALLEAMRGDPLVVARLDVVRLLGEKTRACRPRRVHVVEPRLLDRR